MTVRLRAEVASDADQVRALHATAFADEPVVASLPALLRDREAPLDPLGVVAEDDLDGVVGHVLLTHAWLDARERLVDVHVLSPLGVLPSWQRQGVGAALVAEAVRAADERGIPAVFLEGAPDWYSRQGFVPARPLGFAAPSARIPGDAFQVRLLAAYQPWMTGTLVYPDVFWRLDAVGLRDPLLADIERSLGRADPA